MLRKGQQDDMNPYLGISKLKSNRAATAVHTTTTAAVQQRYISTSSSYVFVCVRSVHQDIHMQS